MLTSSKVLPRHAILGKSVTKSVLPYELLCFHNVWKSDQPIREYIIGNEFRKVGKLLAFQFDAVLNLWKK